MAKAKKIETYYDRIEGEYVAHLKGARLGDPVGYGKTPAEALANLKTKTDNVQSNNVPNS